MGVQIVLSPHVYFFVVGPSEKIELVPLRLPRPP